MSPALCCGIPAYNEQANISACLHSLANQAADLDLETIVCLNGCTDATEEVVTEAKKSYPKLNLKIICSKKGISYAQNAIIKNIGYRDIPVAFIDADVTLDRNCIGILYEEMKRIDKLIVVGSWPIPYKPERMSLRERFLYEILHVRAFHPESEISKHDVSKFKSYVNENPQPAADSSFEVRSKIYFHGRMFMMRNATFFEMPENKNVADDTYLPNSIHTKYGPGTIRTRFDALVYYKPYLSMREHFKMYRRVFLDKFHLDQRFKEFEESRFYEQTKLDWRFILSKGPMTSLKFLSYSFIRNSEEMLYKLLPKDEISDVWGYERK